MLGNWAAHSTTAGKFLPSTALPLRCPGALLRVRKGKAVTPCYSAGGPQKALDFLSHLSRGQQKGQGGNALQLRHLPTGRMSSLYRTESLMTCSNNHRLANSTGKWCAPAFSLYAPPPYLLFFGEWGPFKDNGLTRSSVVTCRWCWLQCFHSNMSVTYHAIIKLFSSIFSFLCSPHVHSGWLYYWNTKSANAVADICHEMKNNLKLKVFIANYVNTSRENNPLKTTLYQRRQTMCNTVFFLCFHWNH